MQEKSDNQKTQNLETDKGFSLLRTDTIQLWIWLQGYQPIDEQSLKSLSEDISYRIRETTDCAVNFMRHCKRSKLKTSDLNTAFQLSNIAKTYGCLNKTPLEYNIIETSELNEKVLNSFRTKLFEVKDEIVELKLPSNSKSDENIEKYLKKDAAKNLRAEWIVVNGSYNKTNLNETGDMNLELNETVKDEFDTENDLFFSPLSESYEKFYEMITSIILFKYESNDSDDEIYSTALNNLRTNTKLQPVLSYLVNFLSQTIQTLTISFSFNTSLIYLERCIDALRCLILNRYLFLAPKGFFSRILSCLLFCTLQNSQFVTSTNGLNLRVNSSYVMVLFLKLYQRFSINTIKYLKNKYITPHLSEKIENNSQLFTLYGVISSLINFGGQMIDEFYEKLIKLVIELEEYKSAEFIIKIDLMAICLKCFLVYFKWLTKKQYVHSNSQIKIKKVYMQVYQIFGDSFNNQLCLVMNKKHKQKNDVSKYKMPGYKFRNLNLTDIMPENKKSLDKLNIVTVFEDFCGSKNFFRKRIQINYGNEVQLKKNRFFQIKNQSECKQQNLSNCKQQEIILGKIIEN